MLVFLFSFTYQTKKEFRNCLTMQRLLKMSSEFNASSNNTKSIEDKAVEIVKRINLQVKNQIIQHCRRCDKSICKSFAYNPKKLGHVIFDLSGSIISRFLYENDGQIDHNTFKSELENLLSEIRNEFGFKHFEKLLYRFLDRATKEFSLSIGG
ncbi:hypothetical protein TUBRATIS_12810 [Tubulinosema ratisbonensis]|uniref:Uncharacterized protein n=1 Tax=Tubulinosema ratisbonensis TaxID=291195 RepID=A0A437AM08_9MICR|nr:hypothetical protein TUBRATIS_12810 [Tubulinosema ratisbonensis]